MVTVKLVSFVTTCTVFIAFISVILQAYIESQSLAKLTTIITGLVHLEYSVGANDRPVKPRIAIGYGSCSDLYVSATTFLNYSNFDGSRDRDYLLDDITNENELLQSFGYYFKNGAAAE